MGKRSKGKRPNIPDPNELIGLQAQTNRINQTTPFGSLQFSGPNRNQSSLQFSPQVQGLFDQVINSAGQLGPIETQDQGKIAGDLFDLGLGRQAPFLEKRRNDINNRLQQSGNTSVGADLAPGAVSELDLLGRQENNLISDLALQSRIGAGQIQGQDIQNQLQAQLGPLQAQFGIAQGIAPGANDFFAPSAVDVTGPFSLQMQAQQQAAQRAQKSRSGFLGGLFDLGAAALPLFGGPAGAVAGAALSGLGGGFGGGFGVSNGPFNAGGPF